VFDDVIRRTITAGLVFEAETRPYDARVTVRCPSHARNLGFNLAILGKHFFNSCEDGSDLFGAGAVPQPQPDVFE
jgi:hypothetical protein